MSEEGPIHLVVALVVWTLCVAAHHADPPPVMGIDTALEAVRP